jgi:hypothetical protein
MSKFFSQVSSPTGLLFIFVMFTGMIYGIYSSADVETPRSFDLLYMIVFLWIVHWWLGKDSRKRGVQWVFDMGLFLSLAWPFIIIYYLFKTRGVRCKWGLFH